MQDIGFAHFLAHIDMLGKLLLFILLAMSVASWYLIAWKSYTLWRARGRETRFVDTFWNDPEQPLQEDDGCHARLAARARHALRQARAGGGALALDGMEAHLTRALRRVLEEAEARMGSGMTLLASVASSAPFVGLFGTVWGVYHALASIGMSGEASLDRVAGPVGEALIMTGLGLAVAIPAVLAYNGFARANAMRLHRLDGFAHDLIAYHASGERAAGRA